MAIFERSQLSLTIILGIQPLVFGGVSGGGGQISSPSTKGRRGQLLLNSHLRCFRRIKSLRQSCDDMLPALHWISGVHAYQQFHTIHVWYIYLHLVEFCGK